MIATAAIALAGCGQSGSGKAPEAVAPEVTVQTMKATEVAVVTELPGRTTAFRVAEVRPQVNGIVKKRLFREGSDVEAGEQLYQIDDAVYRAAYKKAQANLRSAELQAKRDEYQRRGQDRRYGLDVRHPHGHLGHVAERAGGRGDLRGGQQGRP